MSEQSKLAPATLLVLVVLVIVLGTFFRGVHFDLMEFKADEVEAIRLTRYWLSRGMPRFGLVSGAGFRNPPGFIYFLMPLVGAGASPLLIGFCIAAANVAALWLLYRLGMKISSPAAGFWAGAFMAFHPWLILYSRKIWAQSILPLFVLLFLMVIADCTFFPRRRTIFWTGPLLSLIWQIHYSGYCALVFFAVWLTVQIIKGRLGWLPLLAGFLVGILLLSPYLGYLIETGFQDIRDSFRETGRTFGIENAFRLVKLLGKTSFAGGFGYPFAFKPVPLSRTVLGAEQPWLQPLAAIGTGLMIIFIIAGVCFPGREGSGFTPWLVLWAALPVILYGVKGIPAPPHYFIIGLPAVLLLAGRGMEGLASYLRRIRASAKAFSFLPPVAGATVVICGAIIWLSFILFIDRTGGTGGDYGLAYRVQNSVARGLGEERIAPRAIDARLTRDRAVGVFYLLSSRFPEKSPPAPARVRLIDSLLFPGQGCFLDEVRLELKGAGPLKVCRSALP